MTVKSEIKSFLKNKKKGKAIDFSSLPIRLSVALCCMLLLNYQSSKEKLVANSKTLKYWGVCEHVWNKNGNLRTQNRAFESLGYELVNASNDDDWDVLWTVEYPYDREDSKLYASLFKNPLKAHQRVNHFVGIGYIAEKSFLTTTNQDLEFILPSFQLPVMINQLREFALNNPSKKFVRKNIDNRGVEIVDVKNIDLKISEGLKLYQEFMDKPFLIDGHAFDFGVFVVISSLNPLRVYRYETDVLMRFCPEPYYPFDATNIEKFVVYETNKHFTQINWFKNYTKVFENSGKVGFEEYLRVKGHDVDLLWIKIEDAITTLLLRNEQIIESKVSSLVSTDLNSEYSFLDSRNLQLNSSLL
jgi:tubulin monoglycylase TTLL15